MKKYSDCSIIADLLVRSLEEGLTSEEEEKLAQWRKENDRHEALYKRLHSSSFWESHPQRKYREEVAEAWKRLYSRRMRKQRMVRRMYWGVAAVVAISIGTFFLWREPSIVEPVVVENETIVPGKKQAELILADGRSMVLNEAMSIRSLEEKGVVIRTEDKALQYVDKRQDEALSYNTLRVPRGGEYTILLSDGTKVYLNAETEMTYPVAFRGEAREVKLRGEAFFEVAPNRVQPFIVHTEQFAIRVTGTEFNVRAYADEAPSATLAEGSIQFWKGNQMFPLHPGQQAALKNGEIEIRKVNLEDAIAWRYGVFSFKNIRLEDLLSELARWYDIEIFYQNPSLKDLHFTASFQRSSNMEEVISLLERTQKIKVNVNGKTLIVQNK